MARFGKYIIFCAGVLFSLILVDIFLASSEVMNTSVRIDSEKGERYLPNKICNSLFVQEGFGLAKTNSLGWFGPEYILDTDSILSISIVGNSFVASRQVFYRNNFLSICGKFLKDSLNTEVNIYNYGKEAMPIQELLFIIEEIEENTKSDYIIALLNDKSFYKPNRLVPYYEVRNDALRLNTDFRNTHNYKLYSKIKRFEKSSIFFLAYRVKNKIKNWPEIIFDKVHFKKEDLNYANREVGKVNTLKKGDIDILEAIADKSNIIFMLDISEKKYKELKPILEYEICFNLDSVLSSLKNNGVNPNYWIVENEIGHWNNQGHKAIGGFIGAQLLNLVRNED